MGMGFYIKNLDKYMQIKKQMLGCVGVFITPRLLLDLICIEIKLDY